MPPLTQRVADHSLEERTQEAQDRSDHSGTVVSLLERRRKQAQPYFDGKSFDEVCADLYVPVLNYIAKIANDRELAKDVTQEVFTTIFEKHHQYRQGTNLKSWIYRIAHNHTINELRRGNRRKKHVTSYDGWENIGGSTLTPADHLPKVPTPEQHVAELDAADKIGQGLDTMPEFFAEAFVHDVQDSTYKETAEEMGSPLGTVMSRVYRARRRMRKHVLATYSDEDLAAKLDVPVSRVQEYRESA